MDNASTIAARIVQFINESQSKTLLGVRLGALIRHSFPDFSAPNYQCRNLRHFIGRFVQGVRESGHSGADVVYGLADSGSGVVPSPMKPEGGERTEPHAQSAEEAPVDELAWKAFTNPNSRYLVHANKLTGELRSSAERVGARRLGCDFFL